MFSKQITEMDEMVLRFSRILKERGVKFAVISGYVAILFGRSRLSEDVDVLVENLSYEEFEKLWECIYDDFWCIITGDPERAYHDYLLSGFALRFAFKDRIIPNIEVKFPKTELERWVMDNSLEVRVGEFSLPISNIELQIVFKLYLGSEKDIEDALYLYSLFKESLDKKMMGYLINKFGIEDLARRYLKWNSQR